MKKLAKIVTVMLLALTLGFAVAQPALAAQDVNGITSAISNSNATVSTDANNMVAKVITYLWWASIVIAVVVVMVIGIKYIIGSTQEKAEYKKNLIPLVVGVVLVVFATTIVNFLFGLKS